METVFRRPVEFLLAEDNPGDVRLTREGLRESKISNHLHVVQDGIEAMAFVRREGKYADAPTPDIVLLDLNLPKMDGHQVLAQMKTDPVLKSIPVVIMTSSEAEQDVLATYNAHANCYVTKPIDLDHFIKVIQSIEHFWMAVVTLPSSIAN